MKRTPLLVSTLALVLILCAEATSWAAESSAGSKAVATQLFEDAKALIKKGDLASACAKFAESQRLEPQLGTLLRLADCYEKIGKTASAWASFKDAIVIASQRHDRREGDARAEVKKLESRLCKLTIVVEGGAPPDLEVFSNGSSIGNALLGSPMPIDPGDYLLMAKADGFEDWVNKVVIAPGTPSTLVTVPVLVRKPVAAAVFTQQPLPTTPAAPPPIATTVQQLAPAPEVGDSIFSRRTIGYALGAVGIVGIGIGVGFGLAMNDKVSDRNAANACSSTHSCTTPQKSQIDQLTNEANSRATVADVGFIVGGVALAAGAILVVTGWSKGSPSTIAQVQPWIGDKAAGFVAGGVW